MESYNNFANNLSFFAQFSWQNQLLKYYLQSIKLPDVVIGQVNNYRQGVQVPNIGDSREYTSIPLSFILDENFEVYDTLLDMQELYRSSLKTQDSLDVFIQNNDNKVIKKYSFQDVFFISVDGPQLMTTDNDTQIIVNVDMKFSDWNRSNDI